MGLELQWNPFIFGLLKGKLPCHSIYNLGGGNSNIFGIFIPKIGGNDPIWRFAYFSDGLVKNHQRVNLCAGHLIQTYMTPKVVWIVRKIQPFFSACADRLSAHEVFKVFVEYQAVKTFWLKEVKPSSCLHLGPCPDRMSRSIREAAAKKKGTSTKTGRVVYTQDEANH